jgi:protein-tyrosine phosphatase
MLHLLDAAGLRTRVEVDSAGTAAYHVGSRPDARAIAAARRRGIELPGRARQFQAKDFERFDYVLAMDQDNRNNLLRLVTRAHRDRIYLFRQFDPVSPPDAEVPDPYYGDDSGFDEVLDLCLASAQGLIEHLVKTHGLARQSV